MTYEQRRAYGLNKIKAKLTSNEGASIIYALLLFLVCSAVSSIILAAATAAAGRISGAVSSDQRYYSVTGAANLLKKTLDNQSNTIKTVTSPDGESTTTLDDVVWDAMSENDITTNASAIIAGLKNNDSPVDISILIDGFSDLGIKVTRKVDVDKKQMILDISNNESGKSEDDATYTLRLILTAGVETKNGKKKMASGEIVTSQTTKVRWNYYSLETVTAS